LTSRMDELTGELVLAAMEGARELGLEVREIRRGDLSRSR
jgi:hypothetical protein